MRVIAVGSGGRPTCLKKLVTVSVAGRKVAKLHMSSAMLIRSKPFFFLSFHVPSPFFSARKTDVSDAHACAPASHDANENPGSENGSTRVRVRVGAVQTSHAAHDVEEVNGRPGKRHAEAAQATAGLFGLLPQLLQLLLVLEFKSRRGRKRTR